MTTIQPISSLANKNIFISADGGNLSSDAGLMIVKEFLHKIQWEQMVRDSLHFQDERKNPVHPYLTIFQQWIYQLIAGYKADSHIKFLREDAIFQTLLESHSLASQSTYSRFLQAIQEKNMDEMLELALKLTDIYFQKSKPEEMIVDIDSTHCDTYGHQEATNYNAHYGTNGYHPLVAFDGCTGMFLGAQLRSGNVYTSTGAEDFLQPIIERAQRFSPNMKLLIRGDSGFAKPEVYHLCEEKEVPFLIRLKSNVKLSKKAESLVLYGDETDFSQREIQWNEIAYQANTWKKAFRVIIKSTRGAGELLFHHEFLVTNMEDKTSEEIYFLYQKRGEMENFIKEIKNGFFFDKTDSQSFLSNQFRMMLSCIAYSIVHLMKHLVLPENCKKKTIQTLRFQLLHIAGKVTFHARKIGIHLSSSYVYQRLFWDVWKNIQNLVLDT